MMRKILFSRNILWGKDNLPEEVSERQSEYEQEEDIIFKNYIMGEDNIPEEEKITFESKQGTYSEYNSFDKLKQDHSKRKQKRQVKKSLGLINPIKELNKKKSKKK